MKYQPTIRTSNPESLSGLQAGQWIDYEGVTGRYMGRTKASVWIAWSGTARRRFPAFAAAFRANR
jgi:hypothetical protein